MQTKALYAGSFDPFTRGHDDIVCRSLALFSEIIVGIGVNEKKSYLYSPSQRLEQISRYYADEPRVTVISYNSLTIDVAQEYGASVLVRGVRTGLDMEVERAIADLNRNIAGLETVLLPASQQLSHISSSVVRELMRYGRDVTKFLPHGFVL